MLEELFSWIAKVFTNDDDLESIKCPECGGEFMDDVVEINDSNQLEMTCREGHKFEYAI